MDLTVAFERAKNELTFTGHKVFNVSVKHFRTRPAVLAVRPPAYKQTLSAYIIRVFRGKLEIGWLQPDAADRTVRTFLKETYGKRVRERPRLFSHIRAENWERLKELVAKEEREEFSLLVTDTQH